MEGTAPAPIPVVSPTPEEEEETVKESGPTSPTSAAAPLPDGMMNSPALQFVTRKDLYSFLSNAGVSAIDTSTPSSAMLE